MAFCGNCGSQSVNSEAYCVYCGAKLQQVGGQVSGYSPLINSPQVIRFKKKKKSIAIVFFCLFAVGLLAFLLIYSTITRQFSLATALLIYIVVMAVTGLLTFISHRSASASWEGIITDKRIVKSVTRHDDGETLWDETVYVPTLFIRKANGRNSTLQLPDKSLLDYFVIGESIRKHNGFSYPEKYSKSPNVNFCLNCGLLFDVRHEVCPKCLMPVIK